MASGSFKDTAKSINALFVSCKSSRILPEDVQVALQAYLDKHEDFDGPTQQRIHDELKSIHSRHVLGFGDVQNVWFLQILLGLAPAVIGISREVEWWNLALEPVLNRVGNQRDEILYATQISLAFMDHDQKSNRGVEFAQETDTLLKLLLSAYIARTRTKNADLEPMKENDDHIAEQLEEVLIAFGRRKPKNFMKALDELIVDVKTRFQAMSLLCDFVRHQPPHLYTVSETPLIEHLLQCLMIDTSSTIIQITLTTLIMFLPHIPGSIVKHLPRLFLIYTRLLCWESVNRAYRPEAEGEAEEEIGERKGHEEVEEEGVGKGKEQTVLEHPHSDEGNPQQGNEVAWTKLETLMTTLGPITPNLNFYFTFLYGMYPLNFMSYIRKPRRYLKNIDFPRAEAFDFDQALIRSRTDEFRKMHLIHPNFFKTTQDEELEDDRWLKSDPADVVGECMRLYVSLDVEAVSNPDPQSPSHYVDLMDINPENVSTAQTSSLGLTHIHENPQHNDSATSTMEDNSANCADTNYMTGTDSPATVLEQQSTLFVPLPSSHKSLQTRDADGGKDSASLASPALNPAPTLQARSRTNESSSALAEPLQSLTLPNVQIPNAVVTQDVGTSPYSTMNNAFLQREVMILRNDLNFERYLKRQHLSHIGQLQRRQIKEATLEADTQNLIQTNKTLKAKLAKANETYASLKKETATGRQNSKRFETDLSSKVRSLREAQRSWGLREEVLVSELNDTRSDCSYLRRLVVESEARELLAQQKVASMEIQLEQVDELFSKISRLEHIVDIYRGQELAFERAREECKELKLALSTTEFQLRGQDKVTEYALMQYKLRIEKLESQLLEHESSP